MPRKPRLHVPGGIYHVILRGNGCQTNFYDADDRQRWESYIQSGVQRYQHRVHAYCWMTNHVHLAVQANVNPLSQFMAFVASQYARSTNRKMGRSGHLFERRYRAILVQSDSYLMELVRYIHLNPLRAGMIKDLTDYAWSSHAAYQGAACPDWLTLGTYCRSSARQNGQRVNAISSSCTWLSRKTRSDCCGTVVMMTLACSATMVGGAKRLRRPTPSPLP